MDVPDHLKQFEDRLTRARDELLRIADELESVCVHPTEMVGGYDGWPGHIPRMRLCVICGKHEERKEDDKRSFTLPEPTFELEWTEHMHYSRQANLSHLSRFTIQGRLEARENILNFHYPQATTRD